MKNRVEIKTEAKALIRTARVSPLAMTAIVLVIVYILDRVLSLVQFGTLFPASRYLEYFEYLASGDPLAGMDPAVMEEMLYAVPSSTLAGTFLSVLISLFTTVLYGGYYVYCMGVRQGVEMPWSSLLDGLGVAGKLIWCSILMGIKVALWTMLLWVPGIIALYRYRFAIYNLLTDSSLSASQAIRLSCEQTRGMKGRLFVLDLSFFGWSILSVFTFGLLNIWMIPYFTLCDLSYFEEAQLRLGRSPYGISDSAGNPDSI